MGEYFDALCERSAMDAACRRVMRKKARGGLDGVEIDDQHADADKMVSALIKELRMGTYVPVPYARGAIPKFDEQNQWRKISLPSVRDKVVQQAFVEALGPVFNKTFLDCSYAYREGKGPVKAIKRVEHILHTHHIRWVTTMDIDNFFDTMDHDIFIGEFTKKVAEPEILQLVHLWLKAGCISARGDWIEPYDGIAQGAVVSPLFSNIYLHPLDCFAIGNNCLYVRYSDNLIVLSETKETLYLWYEQLKSFLEDRLRLRLNEDPYPFKDKERGFVFLGIFFQNDVRQISTAKETNICRRINWLTDKTQQKDPEIFLEKFNKCIEGVQRYYSCIEPLRQFEIIDQHILKRVRPLLDHFYEMGCFPSRDDLKSYIMKIRFLAAKPDDARHAFCRSLTEEVVKKKAKADDKNTEEKTAAEAEKGKDQSGLQKRFTAQKKRYLRKVADHAELIISSPGVFLGKTGERIVLREKRKNIAEYPFSRIKNITVNTAGVSLSSDIIFRCSRSKIPITFYTLRGMPYATLQSPLHSMGSVSVLQIRTYETEKSLVFIKKVLTGKAKNQINLMKFYLRSRKKTQPEFTRITTENILGMKDLLKQMLQLEHGEVFSVVRDRIFSFEGRISALYWECMRLLVAPELGFEKRNRFQAPDLVNNMLNYGYGILYQRVWLAILNTGMNPHISFLHAFQPNKPTLVYDLVEEYRQPLVDRPVFSLLTRGKKGSDLKLDQQTGMLSKETREKVVKAVLKRFSDLISFRGEKVKYEDVIPLQARKVVAFLEEKDSYLPFIAGY